MTSNCSNKSFSSIFFSVHFIFLVLRFGDLDRRKRNGPTGSFIVIFGSELPDKMYGVCYDDSSQNNIMTDIDKHSQKPYSTPFLTRGWSSYQMPITFPFLATFQSSVGPAQKTARAIFCVKSYCSWEQYLQESKK